MWERRHKKRLLSPSRRDMSSMDQGRENQLVTLQKVTASLMVIQILKINNVKLTSN